LPSLNPKICYTKTNFNAIKKEIKNLSFDSLRENSDNLFEAVIVKDELGKLNLLLKEFFGEPAYPSKDKIPERIQQIADNFGGILPGQTLYCKPDGKIHILAMLWPWNDEKHITLKIIQD